LELCFQAHPHINTPAALLKLVSGYLPKKEERKKENDGII
jgi:hypothetical protein